MRNGAFEQSGDATDGWFGNEKTMIRLESEPFSIENTCTSWCETRGLALGNKILLVVSDSGIHHMIIYAITCT